MDKFKKIYIAGHKGMVGSCLLNRFINKNFVNVITKNKKDLDLKDQNAVENFYAEYKPNITIIAAAKVGGIAANSQDQFGFLYENLMIQNNVMISAARHGAEKIVFLGSSCIYPRICDQPIKEDYLLSGPLEPTNEGYAIAKIAGLKLAKYIEKKFDTKCICPMPCNLYGTNDNFDLTTSHVLSAMVKKFVDAVENNIDKVTLWGSGNPRREFLHVEDAVSAIELLIDRWDSPDPINIGSGTDIKISELAQKISHIAGFKGSIIWDETMPDGTPRKLVDISKIKSLGFEPKISLEEGIRMTINQYKSIKKL